MESPHGIFIDTLARTFDGEENSSQDMGAYIRAVDRVRRTFSAFVCPIHHLNKAGVSARGSSAFFAALDVELTMTKETEAVSMAITKAKEFSEGAPIVFTPHPVEVGKHVTSLVLVTSDLKVSIPSADERRILTLLVDVFGSEGITQSRWENAAAEEGIPNMRFARARRVLVDRGWVQGPPRGAYVRGFRYVATAEGIKVFEGITKVSKPLAHEGIKVSPLLRGDTLIPSGVRDTEPSGNQEEDDDLF
jgi:putative DNA primase/helicase